MSYADRSWLRRRPIVARAHALFIWFWRHHYFNNGEQIAGVGFAHESFPFDTQSLPCLTARRHRQQNALFRVGTVTFAPSAASHGASGRTISVL